MIMMWKGRFEGCFSSSLMTLESADACSPRLGCISCGMNELCNWSLKEDDDEEEPRDTRKFQRVT